MEQKFRIRGHNYKVNPSEIVEGLVKLGIDMKGVEINEIKETTNDIFCECGHRKIRHNQYIDGNVFGCVECDCREFKEMGDKK